jgi:hypothetical protein
MFVPGMRPRHARWGLRTKSVERLIGPFRMKNGTRYRLEQTEECWGSIGRGSEPGAALPNAVRMRTS